MNKLDIKKGNDIYTLFIENRKFLIGSNYITKYNISRNIIEYFSKNNSSEFSKENNKETSILLNDKIMTKKNSFFYHVTPNFSLDNDLKLTSKSLSAKYFDLLYNNHQFSDTLHTINILLESLEQEVNRDSIINVEFTSVIAKQLLKMTNPYINDELLNKNEFDLTYEQIIIYQLQLIKYILKIDKSISNSIILIELP